MAVKSMLGRRALGASGAFAAVSLVESMRAGVLPGIAGLEGVDPQLPRLAADDTARSREISMGLLTAVGFDGNAVAVILEAEPR